MRYLTEEDLSYQKVWLELQALGWNNSELRRRLARVNEEWRTVLTAAFAAPRKAMGLDIPLPALVSIVMTFNLGLIVERLGGIDTGHKELLQWIEQWLTK
jgi:hypothetical protein